MAEMRALVIDEKTRNEISKVLEYAEAHRQTVDDLAIAVHNKKSAVGNDPRFRVYIHDGYRVVYSVEEQPGGTCKHLSVSLTDTANFPSPIAVSEILKEFKMADIVSDITLGVWIEDGRAINILQKYHV